MCVTGLAGCQSKPEKPTSIAIVLCVALCSGPFHDAILNIATCILTNAFTQIQIVVLDMLQAIFKSCIFVHEHFDVHRLTVVGRCISVTQV